MAHRREERISWQGSARHRRKLEPAVINPAQGSLHLRPRPRLTFKLLLRVVAEQIMKPEPGLPSIVSARDHEHGPVRQLGHYRAGIRLTEQRTNGPLRDIARPKQTEQPERPSRGLAK
jgi:hypothetical protein